MGFGQNEQAFIITDKKRILISNDDGRVWSDIGAQYPYVAQVINALDNGDFVVIMGDGNIYRSKDRGANWSIGEKAHLNEILIDLGRGHLFVCSNNSGLLESFDYGNSFSSLGLPNTYIKSVAFEPDSNIIIGTSGRGVLRLNRVTNQWVQLTTGWSPAYVKSIVFDSKECIYVGTSSFGIYRSLDAGLTWNNVSVYLEDMDITSIIIGHRKGIYAVTWTGYIFRSTDKGEHWNCLNQGGSGFGNIDAISLAIDSMENIYVGCLDEGVHRLSNDNKLIPLSNKWYRAEKLHYDMSTNSFYCIIVDFEPISGDLHSGDRRLGTIQQSTDSCRTWKALCPKEKGVECFAINGKGTLLLGTDESGVLRSTDHGKNWQQLGFKNKEITAVAICDSNTIMVATEDNLIYISVNLGNNWTKLETGLPNETYINFLSLGPDSNIYIGAWNGGLLKSVVPYSELLKIK